MKSTSFRVLFLTTTIFISFISTVSTKHHFRHNTAGQRSRHRRQGAKLYLPGSYVIPGGEGDGTWGPWSDPSPCSRTCGGGVSSQERICLADDSQCRGGKKKYFSCNTQDCPAGSQEYRSEQCSAHDDKEFKGIKYNWVPYTKGPNPCELNCMPRGERFYYRFNTKVADGTLCNSESLDVCVDGSCQPVGCDFMLGSDAREDKCRECRGNGTRCKTIEGINNEQNLQSGYNDVLLIPGGATNIVLQEVRPSNNYLAIRAITGRKFYLNGDYRIDFPRALHFAGATWYYERPTHGVAAPDTIRCLGPTQESVYLSLLLLDVNVGVKYEYSIPNDMVPPPDEHYTWTFTEFTTCSASCGGGIQTREVTCKTRDELKQVDDHLCEHYQRPADNQTCANHPCSAHWVEGPWGACSKPCGEGGMQTRQITCQKIIANGLPSLVGDDECIAAQGEKPALHRKCNEGGNCPQWHSGPWLPCDKLCGEGKQRRNVTCFQKEDGKIKVLPEGQCSEPKPEAEKACMIHPCEGVDWVLSDWSGCDSCLSKQRTRTAECITELREVVDPKFCAYHPAPVLMEKCNRTELPSCEVQWYASQWSNCSTKCGDGIQSRKVFCGLFDGESILKVDESRCEAELKYNDSRACNVQGDNCAAAWHAGPWSECTEVCGGGEQYRKVVCLQGNKTAGPEKCGDASVLESSQACNVGKCDEDETIGMKGSTQPMFDHDNAEDYEELEDCAEDEYPDETEDDDQVGLGEGVDETTPGGTEGSTTEGGSTTELSTTPGSTTTLLDETSSSLAEDELIATKTTGTDTTGSTITDMIGEEASGDGEVTSATDSTGSTAMSSTTSEDSSSASTIIETTTDSSSTTEPSTTDSSTTDTTTTDSSTTDSSTTDTPTSTTDSSTDSSSTDSSTTDLASSTTDSASSTVTATDSSTITDSSSTTDSSTSTDSSSTTDSSTVTDSSTSTDSSTGTEGTTETATTGTEVTATTNTGTTDSSSTDSSTDGSTGTETTVTDVTGSTTEVSSSDSSTGTGETSTQWDWSTTLVTKAPRKCRPRKHKPKSKCAKTTFGCCADNVTAAAGPFDAGCSQAKTCKEASYGCCQDGVSAATGPDFEGCKLLPCAETLFGCCKSDNVTASQGNDQEGCPPPPPACKKSKFGCCKDGKTAATGKHKQGCPETATPKIDVRHGDQDCSETANGCCYDNVTVATGPKGEGCPCTATRYGCCPDKETAAQGPKNAGCVVSCKDTQFGCCPDNKTAAHGYLREGCCLSTEFKCCPDNIVPAKGPNHYGCTCEESPYGCCPDKKTSAKGPNNEGCGCEETEHGCCPDKHTPAKGQNFEGCSCHTYQFGCCDDGETPAKGPLGQGCRCQDSEFGCCSDEKTAARGPKKEGCDCSASKYGCCPDGVTEALGEKFLNCTDVPENMQASCGLNKDTGPCRNYTVVWFFDMTYGGCSRFWYGGCDGNTNRFRSQDECQDVCVKPQGKEVCNLPKVKGPCNSYLARWYYDSEREQCGQFVYGGCLGNTNNFESREDCQSLCEKPKSADACQVEADAGSCRGNYARWAYDAESRDCKRFVWGGCEGNDNRFVTEAACKNKCRSPESLAPDCKLQQEIGNCTDKVPKWSFDSRENRCVPFYYSGCGGNGNAFDSEQECKELCPERVVKDVCTLPAQVGECANYQERWYYNTADRRCRQFYYGGCGGNANNFPTQSQCENRCTEHKEDAATPPPFTIDACFLDSERGPCSNSEPRWHYESRTGDCSQFMYGGCGGNANNFPSREHCEYYCGPAQDVCQLPMRVGTCDGSYQNYFYDPSSDSCNQFVYSGCGGNGNRFERREECESRCRRRPEERPQPTRPQPTRPQQTRPQQTRPQPTRPQPTRPQPTQPPPTEPSPASPAYNNVPYPEDECASPQSLEPCGDPVPAYYYDPYEGNCRLYYGGACGHRNRYASEEECQRSCGIFKGVDVCLYPLDPGPCRAALPKVYFDRERKICANYSYGGCEGGPNRFSSMQECADVCHPIATPEEDDRNNEVEPSPCTVYDEQCATMRCPYGPPETTEVGECRQCICRDPCESVRCRPGTSCNIRYRDEELKYVGVCEPTEQVYSEPAPPNFEEEEQSEPEVQGEGGLAVLRCVVAGNPPPTVAWQRGSITIDGSSGRFKILTDGSLQIVSLYRNDSGVYICVADNGIGDPIRKEFNLIVNDPVDLRAGVAGENNAVEIGDIGRPIRLRCAAYGYPTPSVRWLRKYEMVPFADEVYEQSSDFSLLIRSLAYETLGPYTCTVYNGVGKPFDWTVTVKAARPPGETRSCDYWIESGVMETTTSTEATLPPRRSTTPKVIYQVPVKTLIETERTQFAVGSELSLPCVVDGYPDPEVYWLKDATPLNNTDRVHISEAHRLTIKDVVEADSGVYACYARNAYTEYTMSVQIFIEGVYIRPNCTDNPFFANCALIVQAKFCTHQYYADFCCKSCTLAGQLR